MWALNVPYLLIEQSLILYIIFWFYQPDNPFKTGFSTVMETQFAQSHLSRMLWPCQRVPSVNPSVSVLQIGQITYHNPLDATIKRSHVIIVSFTCALLYKIMKYSEFMPKRYGLCQEKEQMAFLSIIYYSGLLINGLWIDQLIKYHGL